MTSRYTRRATGSRLGGAARVALMAAGVPLMALALYFLMRSPGPEHAPVEVADVQGEPLSAAVAPEPETEAAEPAREPVPPVPEPEVAPEAAAVVPPAEPAVPAVEPAAPAAPAETDVAGAPPADAAEIAAAAPAPAPGTLEPVGTPEPRIDKSADSDAPSPETESAGAPGDSSLEGRELVAAAAPEAESYVLMRPEPDPAASAPAPTVAAGGPPPGELPRPAERAPNKAGYIELTFSDLACYVYNYPELETVSGEGWEQGEEPEGDEPPPPPPAADSGDRIPDVVVALTGKNVELQGFMIPTEVEKGRIKSFILVKDQTGCCFGVMPMMNEWVHVKMDEGKTSDFLPDIPLKVTGKIEVGEEYQDGMVVSLYRMTGHEVVPLRSGSMQEFWSSNF